MEMYIGYKAKWDKYIEGYKKRVNSNGYKQILDKTTNRWVTVDYFKGEESHEI